MCDSDPEHARSYCPVTCDTCDSWAPATIGDISFLDSWDEDNCEDVESYCYWTMLANRCMVSPELMLKNCPMSCRQCGPETTTTTTATTTVTTTSRMGSTTPPCEIIQHGSGQSEKF